MKAKCTFAVLFNDQTWIQMSAVAEGRNYLEIEERAKARCRLSKKVGQGWEGFELSWGRKLLSRILGKRKKVASFHLIKTEYLYDDTTLMVMPDDRRGTHSYNLTMHHYARLIEAFLPGAKPSAS